MQRISDSRREFLTNRRPCHWRVSSTESAHRFRHCSGASRHSCRLHSAYSECGGRNCTQEHRGRDQLQWAIPGPAFAVSRKASRSRSTSLTTQTLRSSFIGTAKKFPLTSMEPLRKARRIFQHTANAGFPLLPIHRACASITATIELAQTLLPGNTAARSGRFTSSRNPLRAITIAKYFSL